MQKYLIYTREDLEKLVRADLEHQGYIKQDINKIVFLHNSWKGIYSEVEIKELKKDN